MSESEEETNMQPESAEPTPTPEGHLDPRAQMRIALDKKNQSSKQGQAHLDGQAKAEGAHSKSGGPREFRRKSGG